MKMYEIALFVLVFNIAIAMVNVSGGFTGFDRAEDPVLQTTYVTNVSLDPPQVSQGNDYLNAVGNFIQGLTFFLNFGYSVIAVEGTITNVLGGSQQAQDFGRMVSYIVYCIYGLAIMQYVANRGFKGME